MGVAIGARVVSGVPVGGTRVYVAVGNGEGVSAGLLPPPQPTSNITAVEKRSSRMTLSFMGLC